jgi:hypothetical protein
MGQLRISRIIPVLIALFAGPSLASSYEPNSDRLSADLMSLNYYPHKHKFEVDSHIMSTIADQSKNSDDTKTAIGSNNFNLALTFGFTERVRIGVTENLLWDQINTAVASGGTQTVTTSAGFSNPIVNVVWRYLDSPHNGISAELGVGYMPSFGSKVTGDGAQSKTGNNLTGDGESNLTATFYWRLAWNEIALAGQATGHSEGRTEGPRPITSYDTDAYVSSSALLIERVHFGPNVFVQAGSTYVSALEVQQTSDLGGSRTSAVRGYANPFLNIGFRPDPGVVFVMGAQYHYGSSTITGKNGGALTTENANTSATFTMLHEF